MPAAPQLRPFQYKKGKSGNPGGRPKAVLRVEDVRELMQQFCLMSQMQLCEIIAKPESTMIECMIASIMAKAVAHGDHTRLEFLMARTWGKVKEEVPSPPVHYHPMLDDEPKENILKLLRDLRGPKPVVIDAGHK